MRISDVNISGKETFQEIIYKRIIACYIPRHEAHALKQGKFEGFDSCDRPSKLKLDYNTGSRYRLFRELNFI